MDRYKKGQKKGLSFIIVSALFLTILIFAGCNAEPKKIELDEVLLEENLKGMMFNIVESSSDENIAFIKEIDREGLDELFKQSKAPITGEAFLSAVEGYVQILEESGKYLEPVSIEFKQDGKNIQAVMVCRFEKREVKVNAVFNKKGMIEVVSFSPEYSLGEIAKKAGMNTLIGMGTVFVILAVIAFIISLFKYLPKPKETEEERKPIWEQTVAAESDNKELIAVITAAIVEYENFPDAQGFVVREIVRRKDNRW